MGVPVALHHLIGNRRHRQSKMVANPVLDMRRYRRVGAHRARNLPDTNAFPSRHETFPLTSQFVPPKGQFEAKCHRFSVYAMSTAHHHRVFVADGQLLHCNDGVVQFPQQQIAGGNQLQSLSGIQHIG